MTSDKTTKMRMSGIINKWKKSPKLPSFCKQIPTLTDSCILIRNCIGIFNFFQIRKVIYSILPSLIYGIL